MLTTRQVAKLLGLTPGALRLHIYEGNVRAPTRRAGIAMLWDRRQIRAARKALVGRRRPRKVRQ